MEFQRAFSGAPWESKVGYCRGLRAGNLVFITGTAPIADDGSTFAPGDAYLQTKRCFEIIDRALADLGASLADVVRNRMFITDFSRFDEIAEAHKELFADHPPCATMVEVAALVHPDMILEIEVEAVCATDSRDN